MEVFVLNSKRRTRKKDTGLSLRRRDELRQQNIEVAAGRSNTDCLYDSTAESVRAMRTDS